MRKCNKCGVEKDVDGFSKDSLGTYYKTCKRCKDYNKEYKSKNKDRIKKYNEKNKDRIKEYHKKYSKEYSLKNKDKVAIAHKDYRLKNKDKIKEYAKKHNKKYRIDNKEKLAKYRKEYAVENREKTKQYWNIKYYSDPSYRILQCLRTRVRDVLKGKSKSQPTVSLLGCTASELKDYLSKYFMDNMSWENYGRGVGKWNMDHIIPCAIFDFTDPNEQKQCFHFTNLKPLWEFGKGGNHDKCDKTDGLRLLYNDCTPFV